MAFLNRSPLIVRFLAGAACVIALAALTAVVPARDANPGQTSTTPKSTPAANVTTAAVLMAR